MALSQPAPTQSTLVIGRVGHRRAWLLWISVTVVAALLAAMITWQIRRPFDFSQSSDTQQWLTFVATVVGGLIIAGGQWLVLRRYRIDAYWWIPATITAGVVATLIVVPQVIGLAVGAGLMRYRSSDGLAFGALSLATSGLVTGTAQGFLLRRSGGNIAWVWIPSTVLGGVLAAILTSTLSTALSHVGLPVGIPVVALIGLFGAVSGLASSACQAPVVARIVR